MRIVEREVDRSLKQPVSVRAAMGVIVVATVVTVVIGGILIRLLDPKDYPNIFVGMWWALQTVTTVGYGDVTPKTPFGRIVGAVIMVEAIAFLTVITAAVTSSFVERVRLKYRAQELAEEAAGDQRIEARLKVIADRLDSIEQTLEDLRRQNNATR
ncbi:MAG: potassium channel family protein [Dehalococcoidia bacterium]